MLRLAPKRTGQRFWLADWPARDVLPWWWTQTNTGTPGGPRNMVLLDTARSAGARSMGLLQQIARGLGVGVCRLGDDGSLRLGERRNPIHLGGVGGLLAEIQHVVHGLLIRVDRHGPGLLGSGEHLLVQAADPLGSSLEVNL